MEGKSSESNRSALVGTSSKKDPKSVSMKKKTVPKGMRSQNLAESPPLTSAATVKAVAERMERERLSPHSYEESRRAGIKRRRKAYRQRKRQEHSAATKGATITTKGTYVEKGFRDRFQKNDPLHLSIKSMKRENVERAVANIARRVEDSKMRAQFYEQFKIDMAVITPGFDPKSRIAGETGDNFKFIESETGARITLRGRTSGFIEPRMGRESSEPLHILVEHETSYEGYQKACRLVQDLIQTVKEDLKDMQKQQPFRGHGQSSSYPESIGDDQRTYSRSSEQKLWRNNLSDDEQSDGDDKEDCTYQDFDSNAFNSGGNREFERAESSCLASESIRPFHKDGWNDKSRAELEESSWDYRNQNKRNPYPETTSLFNEGGRPIKSQNNDSNVGIPRNMYPGKRSEFPLNKGIIQQNQNKSYNPINDNVSKMMPPQNLNKSITEKPHSFKGKNRKTRWDTSANNISVSAVPNKAVLGVVLDQKKKIEEKLNKINSVESNSFLVGFKPDISHLDPLNLSTDNLQKLNHQELLQVSQQQRDLLLKLALSLTQQPLVPLGIPINPVSQSLNVMVASSLNSVSNTLLSAPLQPQTNLTPVPPPPPIISPINDFLPSTSLKWREPSPVPNQLKEYRDSMHERQAREKSLEISSLEKKDLIDSCQNDTFSWKNKDSSAERFGERGVLPNERDYTYHSKNKSYSSGYKVNENYSIPPKADEKYYLAQHKSTDRNFSPPDQQSVERYSPCHFEDKRNYSLPSNSQKYLPNYNPNYARPSSPKIEGSQRYSPPSYERRSSPPHSKMYSSPPHRDRCSPPGHPEARRYSPQHSGTFRYSPPHFSGSQRYTPPQYSQTDSFPLDNAESKGYSQTHQASSTKYSPYHREYERFSPPHPSGSKRYSPDQAGIDRCSPKLIDGQERYSPQLEENYLRRSPQELIKDVKSNKRPPAEDPFLERQRKKYLRMRVAVMDKNLVKFNPSEELEIKKIILKEFTQLSSEESKNLEFLGFTSKNYLYVLMPHSLKIMNWLLKIKGLKLNQRTLEFFMFDDIHNRYRVKTSIYFDILDGYKPTPEEILLELRRMNDGLATELWKVIKFNEEEMKYFLMLSIDYLSFLCLIKMQWKAKYRTGQISLEPTKSDAKVIIKY